MDVDEKCYTPDVQVTETVDLVTKGDIDLGETQAKCVTANAKPEEGLALTTSTPVNPNSLTPNTVHQSTSNLGLKVRTKKFDDIKEKGVVNKQEKFIYLRVKGDTANRTTIRISEDQITTLVQKQKAGVPIALAGSSSHNPDDSLFKKFKIMKSSNSLTLSPRKTHAQKIPIPVSSPPSNVSTGGQKQQYPADPPFINPFAFLINNTPPPIYPNSTVTTLNNVGSVNPGVSAATQNISYTPVSNVSRQNPVASVVLPVSQNGGVQDKIMGMGYNFVAPTVTSNTPRTVNINVLPRNPSICYPAHTTVQTILPKPVIIPGVPNTSMVCTTSADSAIIAVSSSNSLINITPNQPQFTYAKMQDSSYRKVVVPFQLKSNTTPSGEDAMVTESVPNVPSANPSVPSNVGVRNTKERFRTVVVRPVKERLILPKQMQEVIMPRIQAGGSAYLQKLFVSLDKMRKTQNQFIVNEVSNNPDESGVVKKFVVSPASSVALPPLLPQENFQSTTSTTVSPAETMKSAPLSSTPTSLSSTPPWLLNKRPEDICPQSSEKDGATSSKSAFQWHHPYTGDSPSQVNTAVVAGDHVTENDPVRISDDDDDDDDNNAQPCTETSSPRLPVLGSPKTNDGSMCISGDEKLVPEKIVLPPLANTEKYSGMPTQFSLKAEELSTENDQYFPRIENNSVHSIAQHEVLEELNFKSNNSSSNESKFLWHHPCVDAEAPNPRDSSALIESPKMINEAPPVKFQVKFKNCSAQIKRTSSNKKRKAKKMLKDGKLKKKKKKKVSLNKNVLNLDSKAATRKNVSSSSLPSSTSEDMDPLSSSAIISSLEENPFQWHHPSLDTNPEKATGKSEVVRYSGLKTEPVNLPDSNGQHAQESSSLGYGLETSDTEDPNNRSDAGVSVINEQDSLRIEIDSVHSVTECKCVTISSSFSDKHQKQSSYSAETKFHPSLVADDKKETISAENSPACAASQSFKGSPKERNLTILNKRRLKASSTVRSPLKRVLAESQDKPPLKVCKMTQNSASTARGNQCSEQVGNSSKFSNERTKQELCGVERNVLRECIIRKTIQDCYLEGVIPTIDKVHNACCDSGLELPKTSVEPYLFSMGYNWLKGKSQKFLLEDHQFTAERIKYLEKLNKYQGKNLVYIFVSEFVKKNGNVWQVSSKDVKRPSLDAARVVLHAVSNNRLLKGGLDMVKLGLFGLKRNDVISWLKCKVIPNIPQGSVVIFGYHPVFNKDDETEKRPKMVHSKEEIISWLTSHNVTSVNPDSPKALLLCKADRVILPKTSIFDKLIRRNGFVPLHLPKHHMELNPVGFIWRDILDKLHKTPGINSVDDLQDFVTREFSSCSQMLSSVACNLVRKFGCSYREFDSCFDERLEKLLLDTPPVPDASQVVETVADAAEKSTRSGKLPFSKCPICLGTKRFKGYRCSMCKNFWYKLMHDYKFRHQTGAALPVCKEITHIVSRPPDCLGCRRHRYELSLFNEVNIMKKRPQFVLPIPPVTEIGKKHWSKKVKKHPKKPPNLRSSSVINNSRKMRKRKK